MQITTDELRRMTNQEGLILQGCGGDVQEWIDGINELLTQEGILLEGTKFKNVKSFRNEGLTNLLFPFEDVKLDLGKLAIWRIQSHETFGVLGCLIMFRISWEVFWKKRLHKRQGRFSSRESIRLTLPGKARKQVWVGCQ